MAGSALSRRRFIVSAITLACGAATLGTAVLGMSRAWAQGALDDVSRKSLARVARHMYPHDAIGDEVYAETLDQAMDMVANDAMFVDLLEAAEGALNSQTGGRFVDVTAERQLAALHAIERHPAFGAILGAVGNRLYNHPAVWRMLGYEGSSWEKGGYLGRGAGEVDWLPEASS